MCLSVSLSLVLIMYLGGQVDVKPHLSVRPKSQGRTHSITRAMRLGLWGWSLILLWSSFLGSSGDNKVGLEEQDLRSSLMV